VLLENPFGSFSHTYAAKYAGLGTVGVSRNLLTPQWGPRVRFGSVFTAVSLLATESCLMSCATAVASVNGCARPRLSVRAPTGLSAISTKTPARGTT